MSRTVANAFLLVAGLVWGMGFVAQQSAMDSIGPMLFIGLRFLLAAAVVAPFGAAEAVAARKAGQHGWFTFAQARQVALVGCVFFTAMSFQQIGLMTTSVTNAGFLTGLYVVMVPVLLRLVLREPPHWIVWPTASASLLGIYLLGGASLEGLAVGDGLVIISAFFWAVQLILLGKTVRSLGRPVQIAALQFAVCGTLAIIGHTCIVLLGESREFEPLFSLDAVRSSAVEIVYAAVFAGGVAFSLQAIAQRHTRDADAAILLSSESLFAALFGAILLEERLGPTAYLGCGLIFAAIVSVQIVPTLLRERAHTT